MDEDKPSIDEVIAYATRQIQIYIGKLASSLPHEQRDEIIQTAYLRICSAYKRLDATKGWKSFVQMHCRGTVLDYIRWGNGFEEVTLNKKTDDSATPEPIIKPWKLTNRVQMVDKDGEGDISLDATLGIAGVFFDPETSVKKQPRWKLISHMAAHDIDVHIVAKVLLGFTHNELTHMFKVSRERITQRIQEFCKRLDSAEHLNSLWVAQTIYAFNLCEQFHMPDKDLGFGYEFEPVDLYSRQKNYIDHINPQISFVFEWP